MILPDVNVLVYASRSDCPDHEAYRLFLQNVLTGTAPFALAVSVISGFLRIVTNRRIFPIPTPLSDALAFARALASAPNAVVIHPAPGYLDRFLDLVAASGAMGKLVPDAELAALARAHGCELATSDRDFARFTGLRWFRPLDRTR